MKLYLKYKSCDYETTYNNVIRVEIYDGNLSIKQIDSIFVIVIPLKDIDTIRYNVFE